MTNIDAALAEAHRVLTTGGRFLCLEFSQVEEPLLRVGAPKFAALNLTLEKGGTGSKGVKRRAIASGVRVDLR